MVCRPLVTSTLADMQGQSLEGNPLNEQECVPPSTFDASQSLREKLATACRILGTEGHNDIVYGHMSARIPSTARFWLKGGGLGLEEITPTDLVELDLDGHVLAGEGISVHYGGKDLSVNFLLRSGESPAKPAARDGAFSL